MSSPNNIYSYKSPKSMNDESHYLLTNGRITIKTFIIRFLFACTIIVVTNLIYTFYALERYSYWETRGHGNILNPTFLSTFNIFKQINFLYLPILLSIFVIIQGVKRVHDTNKSGWFLLIPLYNILLLFSKGTVGNNDFGIDPSPIKVVKYFDEMEKTK
jgi:uncharacterized membrane protein YhaH (DUF805 family)